MSLRHALQAKGVLGLGARAGMILSRFGISTRRMDRDLSRYLEITQAGGIRPSFPITTTVLRRHPDLVRSYLVRGVEFAMHGLVHGDHDGLGLDEQVSSFAEADAVFRAAGIPCVGFRAPYLRANSATREALRTLGFRYDSSQAVAFPVIDDGLDPVARRAYARALDYYHAQDAGAVAVRPRCQENLVELPVAVPDDEIMVDRLRMTAEAQARAWLAIFEWTYRRAELFTLQLHPERIAHSGLALSAVLAEARRRTPAVWLATLADIAGWWRDRAGVRLRISAAGPDRFLVEVAGDPRATVIGHQLAQPGQPAWWGSAAIFRGPRFEVTAARMPVVALSRRTPVAVAAFLREEGFLCEVTEDAARYGAAVDVLGDAWTEQALLEAILAGPGPVLQVSRWPDAARSALAVTGDVDALTLQDFLLRLYETSSRQRARRLERWDRRAREAFAG